jgi:hypothetical protein
LKGIICNYDPEADLQGAAALREACHFGGQIDLTGRHWMPDDSERSKERFDPW